MTPKQIAALPTPLTKAQEFNENGSTYVRAEVAEGLEQDRAALMEALLLFVVPALRAWVDAKKQIEECVDLKGDLQLYAQAAEQDLGDALFVADETLAAVRAHLEAKDAL